MVIDLKNIIRKYIAIRTNNSTNVILYPSMSDICMVLNTGMINDVYFFRIRYKIRYHFISDKCIP